MATDRFHAAGTGLYAAIVRHGTLVAVVSLLLAVLGVLAVMRIPVQMIPDLEVRTITVQTSWAGATPQDMEKDILLAQEEVLRALPGLRRMSATAGTGSASIALEFPFDVDLTETLIRVNNALSRVSSYPENVSQPRIVAASFSSNAFMFFSVQPLPGNPRQLELTLMRDFIEDNVRPRMESVPGVSEVTVGGGAERQVQLWLDPERLAAVGLTVADVRSALRARNRDVSGGVLEEGKRRYLLRTVGRFDSAEELQQLILARRGDSVVRLGEVARVVSHHYPVQQLNRVNGQAVLGLQVRRESGSNVIAIKQALTAEVERLNADLLQPAGLTMTLNSDDVRYVEASVRNVWTSLALGAVLAALVLAAFLRSGRATLTGVVGIPLCTLAAFIGLLLAGRTLNVISLAGVAFAIGMTVDNSIVVLENIERARRRGLERVAAAVAGVREVAPAVLASTLTTVLVFLPVLFIEQEAGQLYSDIAVAISAAILVSMAVSLTIVPALAARLDFRTRVDDEAASGPAGEMPQGRTTRATMAAVGWLLASRWRRLGALGGSLLAGLAVALVLTPPAEYLPEGEEPKTFASMSAPPGYNLSEMDALARQVEQAFLPHVGADRAAFAEGRTPVPPIAYINLAVQPERVRIIAEASDPRDIEPLMDALTEHYQTYPGMRAFAARGSIISSNDGGTRSINVDIAGADLQALYQVATAVDRRAREVFDKPRIQSQPSSMTLAQPLVEVRPDWDRAAELGLDAGTLGFTVAALTDGAYIDELILDDRKVDVFAYGPGGPGARLSTLAATPIRTPQGSTLPLASVASIEERVDVSQVRRVDGRRTVTVSIIPPRSVPLEAGVDTVRRDVVQALQAQGAVPAGVSLAISGAADQLDATREALAGNFIVAVLIIYLVLVAIFTHWGYPLLVLATIPLGLVGGIAGLALLNLVGGWLPALGAAAIVQPLDMISMLGFLILLGTVVNNPILVVDRARALRAQQPALPVVQAVQQAVASRLRPIAMTTLTTIVGLLPLVLLPGEGSELYRGVGVIVLAGLVGAALVTLVFLPALLATTLALGDRLAARRGLQPA
jgi:multidrug efflux pump subunit AcrB